MRVYVDAHLCPNVRDLGLVDRMVRKARELGYRLIAIPLPQDFGEEAIKRLRGICMDVGLDLVTRVDLKPRTPGELLRSLRKLRRRFELISVCCESKSVSRKAANDRRVDLLNFPSTDVRKRFFDVAEAELASSSLASFEIDVKPLLTLNGHARVKLLSALRKEVTVAKDFHVPIVVSSGATEEALMRRPREVAALTSLFDLDRDLAVEAVSRTPLTIIERSREKLSPNFVAPGIRVIKGGEVVEKGKASLLSLKNRLGCGV